MRVIKVNNMSETAKKLLHYQQIFAIFLAQILSGSSSAVELLVANEKVAGSSPVSRSK